jgi:16S rRNA C1402 N4-methylase RsmH
MVKQTFRAYRDAGRMDPIAKKPVIASEAEIAANPRASSAKLRWAVRS